MVWYFLHLFFFSMIYQYQNGFKFSAFNSLTSHSSTLLVYSSYFLLGNSLLYRGSVEFWLASLIDWMSFIFAESSFPKWWHLLWIVFFHDCFQEDNQILAQGETTPQKYLIHLWVDSSRVAFLLQLYHMVHQWPQLKRPFRRWFQWDLTGTCLLEHLNKRGMTSL